MHGVLIGTILVLSLLGMPIGYALGSATLLALLEGRQPQDVEDPGIGAGLEGAGLLAEPRSADQSSFLHLGHNFL